MDIINKSILDFHLKLNPNQVLLYYKGSFTDKVLSALGEELRHRLKVDSEKSGMKVFRVYMELAKNISIYSAEALPLNDPESNKGIGVFCIESEPLVYKITACNLIKAVDAQTILDRFNTIYSLDWHQLRQYKRELRMNVLDDPLQGANIGLIQIALTTRTIPEIKIMPVNKSLAYFIIQVNVSK